MPLVPLRPLMEAAEKYNYAQGAFNVNAVAQAKAVIEMHETFRSPAILQGADLANAFMGGRVDFANGTLEDKKKGARNIANAVKKYGENSPIPVVLHLDHGKDFDSCVAAIEGGYTSVMIDGSSLPLEQNIELTREVVKYAHARGVSVEGELGVLGGQEDHVFAATSTYTNPLDAVEFIQKTGVAWPSPTAPSTAPTRARTPSSAVRSPSPSRSASTAWASFAPWCPTAPPPCPSTSSRRSTTWAATSRTPTASTWTS